MVRSCAETSFMELDFYDHYEFHDIPSDFFSRYRRLQHLKISHRFFRDETLIELIQNNRNLQTLDVFDCKNLTDASIFAVAQNCHNLQTLCLSCGENITDRSIMAMAQNCSNLKNLKFSCKGITDASVVALVQKCPNLQDLEICVCGKITDTSIVAAT